MDYYKTLGVDKNATEADIKKAYRKFAHQYHPDSRGGGDEKKFKEVTEAYEVLSDKQKRAQYDQFGSVGKGAGGNPFGGFDFSGFENINFDFGSNFGDIFDTFFGGGGRPPRAGSRGPARGNDLEVVVHLTFEESIFGTTKEIELNRYETCDRCAGKGALPGSDIILCKTCQGSGQKVRVQRTPLGQIQTASPCPDCRGRGRVPEKQCAACEGEGRTVKESAIKVKIPAGIHDKAVVRLSGKGEAGAQGGEQGDLFVHVAIAPGKEFDRKGDDLYATQKIHLLQAVLGDEIFVRTVHGEVPLKIPAGTEGGKVFKIKGYGVPKVGASSRGDHYVTLSVTIPAKLSKKERELYEDLAEESGLNIKPQGRGIFG